MSNTFVNIPNYSWKSPVSTATALPTSSNTIGDVRLTTDTGAFYFWTGTAWNAVESGAAITSLNGLTGSITIAGDSYIAVTPSGSTITLTSTSSWKFPVLNYAALPASGNTIGDVIETLNNNSIWTWNGTHWVATGYANVDGGTSTRAFASNMNINGGNASSRP